MFRVANEEDRYNYADTFIPEEGYQFVYALGTTYSLDLEAMLSVPIAAGLHSSFDEKMRDEGIHILEAIRKTAAYIDLFCQQGKIQVPPKNRLIFSLMEESIHQVLPNEGTSFHPKLWIVKYENPQTSKVYYKLVVMSRNLTFDRSWDISCVLDGKKTGSKKRKNKSLIRMLKGLVDSVDHTEKKKIINDFIEEIEYVAFNIEGSCFNDYELCVLGKDGESFNIIEQNIKEIAVISPFLSHNIVEALANRKMTNKMTLISQKDQLSILSEQLIDKLDCYCVADMIVEGENILSEESSESRQKQDIHAKVYIIMDEAHTHIYMGSCNCSNRGFYKNTEFMIKLTCDKRTYSVQKFLKELGIYEDKSYFEHYQYTPLKDLVDIDEQLKEIINGYATLIGSTAIKGEVKAVREGYETHLYIDREIEAYKEVEIRIAPLFWEKEAKILEGNMVFEDMEITQLTKFFKVSISLQGVCQEFLLKVDLANLPSQREKSIIKQLVKKEQIIQYLILMLSDDPRRDVILMNSGEGNEGRGIGKNYWDKPLYENLLRAFKKDQDIIGEVKEFISMFKDTDVVPGEIYQLLEVFERMARNKQ